MLRNLQIVLALWCMALFNCVKTEIPDKPAFAGKTGAAACIECHSYPGSVLCRTDSLVIDHKVSTQCYACHLGSIKLDSSFDTSSNAFRYHDAMLPVKNRNFPITDSLHTDHNLTLKFAQCTFCHSYPPNSGKHIWHVTDQGKNCYECHFSTVLSDKNTDTAGTGLNTLVNFVQRFRVVPGGKSLPIPNYLHHLDHSVTVSFRKKNQVPPVPDSLFHFNSFDKSCTNIACHKGVAQGGESVERSLWKE
jgi:hypothetical protein